MNNVIVPTRCPSCSSDKIYILQEETGGICTVCKTIINETIIGGMSFHEFVRDRGIVPREPMVNENSRSANIAKLKEDVRKILKTVTSAKTAWVADTPVAAPAPETAQKAPSKAAKKPGIWSKFIKILTSEDKKTAKPTPPVSNVKRDNERPKIGERWTVGPCALCGNNFRQSGEVVENDEGSYILIENSSGTYSGCFLCSRRA